MTYACYCLVWFVSLVSWVQHARNKNDTPSSLVLLLVRYDTHYRHDAVQTSKQRIIHPSIHPSILSFIILFLLCHHSTHTTLYIFAWLSDLLIIVNDELNKFVIAHPGGSDMVESNCRIFYLFYFLQWH